jgi:hypothetical protein
MESSPGSEVVENAVSAGSGCIAVCALADPARLKTPRRAKIPTTILFANGVALLGDLMRARCYCLQSELIDSTNHGLNFDTNRIAAQALEGQAQGKVAV